MILILLLLCYAYLYESAGKVQVCDSIMGCPHAHTHTCTNCCIAEPMIASACGRTALDIRLLYTALSATLAAGNKRPVIPNLPFSSPGRGNNTTHAHTHPGVTTCFTRSKGWEYSTIISYCTSRLILSQAKIYCLVFPCLGR